MDNKIEIDDELVLIVDNLSSKITRIYNGKILPQINKNYINIVSPYIDLKLAILYTFWNIFEQNTFNNDMCGLIITNSDYDSYNDLLKSIGFSDQIEIVGRNCSSKSKKNAKLAKLFIANNNIEKLTEQFKPDLIMIDGSNLSKTDNIINEKLVADILKRNIKDMRRYICVISFTWASPTHKFFKTDAFNIINNECETINDRLCKSECKLKLSLVKLDDNKSIFARINKSLKNIMIIMSDKKECKDLYKICEKMVNFDVCDSNQIGIRKFLDTTHEKTQMILFIESDLLEKHINDKIIAPNNVRNIDCLVILDDIFKHNYAYYKIVTYILKARIMYDIVDTSLTIIEKHERNLHQQLFRLNSMFYNTNVSNVEMYENLVNDIKLSTSLGTISQISLDVEFNEMRRNKLERMFKITSDDRENYEKKYTYIIAIIPTSSKSEIYKYYQNEEPIIKNQKSINELKNEIDLIKKRKKIEYSGPKWLSGKNNEEIIGNKVGFASEVDDVITFCEILDIRKITQRNKRPKWMKNDIRNRNVLFLSHEISQMKLSEFKQLIDVSPGESIGYMKKFLVYF